MRQQPLHFAVELREPHALIGLSSEADLLIGMPGSTIDSVVPSGRLAACLRMFSRDRSLLAIFSTSTIACAIV
ncbi:MAG: hypothetical protein J2P47_11765 [Acetobacteraceae bacterium]|nr:hypothetical protein [Acetobacteraceae bacterium]